MLEKKKYVILLIVISLVIIGLAMVYSSSNVWAYFKFNDPYYFFKRQVVFAGAGFVCMYLISKINLEIFKKFTKLFLYLSLLSLILVIFLGVERNGSRSWFKIGSFLLQPSEFFKIAIIFYTAKTLENHSYYHLSLWEVKNIIFYALLGFGLIMLQPDLGSGIVMLGSVFIMLFCSALDLKYFIYIIIIGILGFTGLVLTAGFRIKRILSFIDPWQDPLGSGFQTLQALFAIGPGGLLGVGFNNSVQKHFYLPEPQTDFIFAIFLEEMGFVGGLVVVSLYFILIYTVIKEIKKVSNNFYAYCALGLISILFIQVLINIGVVIGLLPITGLTLPFFSYGGSSLVMILISIGICLKIIDTNR